MSGNVWPDSEPKDALAAANASQCANNVFNIILLKKPDTGDTDSARFETRGGILQGHAAQREDRNFRMTDVAQNREARRRGAAFFKDRRKDSKVRTSRFGAHYVCPGVTRNCDHRPFAGEGASATQAPYATDFRGRNVV